MDQVLQGTEPMSLPAYNGGWLNIFMAKSYTFQDGYLIGWQMFNKFDSISYFVDVFRSVAVVDHTSDLVHSTEIVTPKAGNRSILLANPVKVCRTDSIIVTPHYTFRQNQKHLPINA
jgi:hypothetical protein